ncbi:unnamed protein product [Ixodes persulcatus]
MEVERLTAVGKELGYAGQELRKWVDDERARLREERAHERELARENREGELATLREGELAKQATLDKESEILQLRIAARGGHQERADEGLGDAPIQALRGSPHKLMPQFNERRDDLDAYLQRFERTATGLGCPQDKWATTLGLCLTGEALTVVCCMTPTDALDYPKVKLALLQRFRYTKEGYRERFRDAKPEEGETRRQFAARLAGYFDRWVEVSEIEKTFEALRDTVLVEQFLGTCSSKLAVFLKERYCRTLDEVAKS